MNREGFGGGLLRSLALPVLVLFAGALLAGCASAPRAAEGTEPALHTTYVGRLALVVTDRPAESFSASFELRGSPETGELKLEAPLLGTLGVLSWQPGSATLQTSGQVRQFESIDALVTHATGSSVPVAALFEWLRGIDSPVAGWRADLSQAGEGRVTASRQTPTPQAELRVVFELQAR